MTETADVRTSAMQMHSALSLEETERLTADIVAALKTVFDPDSPADICELGLSYTVEITNERAGDGPMTLLCEVEPPKLAVPVGPPGDEVLPGWVRSMSTWSGSPHGHQTG